MRPSSNTSLHRTELATKRTTMHARVCIITILVSLVTCAPTSPSTSPRALGAACECRCCWDIGGGRKECTARFHEFLLRPAECGAKCSDGECAARFGDSCHEPRARLNSVCRRGAPRALALLCFLGAALALLFFAFIRQPPQPFIDGVNDELTRRDSDIRERHEYGSLRANDPKLSQDLPFLIPQPPENDVSVEKGSPLA